MHAKGFVTFGTFEQLICFSIKSMDSTYRPAMNDDSQRMAAIETTSVQCVRLEELNCAHVIYVFPISVKPED